MAKAWYVLHVYSGYENKIERTIRMLVDSGEISAEVVTDVKVPSEEEADHDFLWRVHMRVPGKGEIGIFNRSHYEAVLVERVMELTPKSVWSHRYEQIN